MSLFVESVAKDRCWLNSKRSWC